MIIVFFKIHELPKPSYLNESIEVLGVGTYTDIEVAHHSTLIIEALDKFVKRRISALPIVDEEGKLTDIYAKFDVIVSFQCCKRKFRGLSVSLLEAFSQLRHHVIHQKFGNSNFMFL